jgi:hypothetical protein
MSLVIKEMQIKTILIFHLTSVRTQITANTNKDVGKKEPSYTVGGNVN